MNTKNTLITIIILVVLLLSTIYFYNATVGADPNDGIFLIDGSDDWVRAGFVPDGSPVYEEKPDGFFDYFMPVALKKEDVHNLRDSDVEHTFKDGNVNFYNVFRSVDFEILESSTYYVVLYHMSVYAGANWSVDFIPKIKGEELYQYAWWSSSWNYLKIGTIANKKVDFQTMINVSYSSGSLNLSGHCQTDFDDLRVVALDNVTELPYYIEDISVSSYCHLWFNNTVNTSKICLYYGNPSCDTTSNPDTTFDFWANRSDSGSFTTTGLVAVNDAYGLLQVKQPLTTTASNAYINIGGFSGVRNYESCFKSNLMGETSTSNAIYLRSSTTLITYSWIRSAANNDYVSYYDGSAKILYDGIDDNTSFYVLNQVCDVDIDKTSSFLYEDEYASLLGSGLTGSNSNAVSSVTNFYFTDGTGSSASFEIYFEYLRVRNYSAVSPTISGWSIEFSKPTGNDAPTISYRYPSDSYLNCPCCAVMGFTPSDNQNLTLNASLYSNHSGSWILLKSWNNIPRNVTLYYRILNITGFDFSFEWNCSVSDTQYTVWSSNYTFMVDTFANCNISTGGTMFLGEIIFQNAQYFLALCMGVWVAMLVLTEKDRIYGLLQTLLGIPLSLWVLGISYFEGVTFGYLVGIGILLTTVFVLIRNMLKG